MNSSDLPKPAALYARLSSDRQDMDLSVAAQLRATREHAERNGLRMGWSCIRTQRRRRVRHVRQARPAPGPLIDTNSNVDELLNPGIAVPTETDGAQSQSADFTVTAGRDQFGANQAVMPRRRKLRHRGKVVDVKLNDRTS